MIRTCGALYILSWKCASRHNGVRLFISHRARWVCTRRFSKVTFRPSGATHKSLEKHSESWLSYLFAHLHLLSSHIFSFLIFSLLFFSSLTLSTSAFPSLHIVGRLTSRLSSIIFILSYYTIFYQNYIYIISFYILLYYIILNRIISYYIILYYIISYCIVLNIYHIILYSILLYQISIMLHYSLLYYIIL